MRLPSGMVLSSSFKPLFGFLGPFNVRLFEICFGAREDAIVHKWEQSRLLSVMTRVCIEISSSLMHTNGDRFRDVSEYGRHSITAYTLFTVLTSLSVNYDVDLDPNHCRHASGEVNSLPFKSQTALLPIVTTLKQSSHDTEDKQTNKRNGRYAQ